MCSHNDDEKYKKDLQVFTQAKGINIEVTVESIVEELVCKVEDEETCWRERKEIEPTRTKQTWENILVFLKVRWYLITMKGFKGKVISDHHEGI